MNLLSDLSLWYLTGATLGESTITASIEGLYSASENGSLSYTLPAVEGDTVTGTCSWDMFNIPDSGEAWFVILDGDTTIYSQKLYDSGASAGEFEFDVEVPAGSQPVIMVAAGIEFPQNIDPPNSYGQLGSFVIAAADVPPEPSGETVYNCDCDDDFPTETLAELRQKVLIEMGYSAQLASPPANVVLKINQALQYAQKFAFSEFYDSKLERFFTWDMVEGVRFYDIPQNIDECTKKLNIHRITWVGVQENNDRWYPLVFGIPPEFYTEPQITTRPNRYEIRQCIEVWPAPGSDLYRLRIKGEFGLLPFTDDAHVTTIDPDVIFYGACFRLMRRRGDADADDYAGMQQRRMEQITEAMHFTARYVPGSRVQTDEARPIFLPLLDE